MEIHREILKKFCNQEHSSAITQNRENGFPVLSRENRPSSLEHVFATVDLNIVVLAFMHNKAIFRKVTNKLRLDLVPIVFPEDPPSATGG